MKKTAPKQKKSVKLQKRVNRHIKLAVVPHKANQYRPHLIRRYGLVAVIVLTIGLQLTYNWTTSGSVLGSRAAVTTEALLVDTNTERNKHGLPALAVSEQLSTAAFLKARDMFEQQYWAHNAPDGTTPWRWFADAGYNYSRAGENLAKNFKTADAATTAWMASAEHRANLLEAEYVDVGFAVVDGVMEGKPTTIIVALYGQPAGVTAAVAGAHAPVAAPEAEGIGPITRFGVALQSITPAALGSMMVMMMVGGVALFAHMYRNKLPKTLRQSWYRHHGMIKVTGMMSLCLIILVLYSGGSI